MSNQTQAALASMNVHLQHIGTDVSALKDQLRSQTRAKRRKVRDISCQSNCNVYSPKLGFCRVMTMRRYQYVHQGTKIHQLVGYPAPYTVKNSIVTIAQQIAIIGTCQ